MYICNLLLWYLNHDGFWAMKNADEIPARDGLALHGYISCVKQSNDDVIHFVDPFIGTRIIKSIEQ